jgi:hypothetical protein
LPQKTQKKQRQLGLKKLSAEACTELAEVALEGQPPSHLAFSKLLKNDGDLSFLIQVKFNFSINS